MPDPNPFDLEELDADETGGVVPTGDDSKNFADMRAFAKRRDKEAKQLEKELAELKAFKDSIEAKDRDTAISAVFTEVGLNPKHAALFKLTAGDGEVTADAVKAFAAEYELVTTSGEEIVAPEKPAGFTPVTTGNAPDPTIITIEQATEMLRTGRGDEAQKMYEQGKVQKLERDANGSPIVDWLARN